MRTSEIKNLAVITVPSGKNIGKVNDVLLHAADKRVGGIVIDSNENDVGFLVAMVKDITGIGEDAVTIASEENLRDQTYVDKHDRLVSTTKITGHQVATRSGNYVGKLSDVHIDTKTQKITGFEVTGGLFARIFGVTHTIEADEHTSLGRDLLIIADKIIPTHEAPKVSKSKNAIENKVLSKSSKPGII